MIVSVHVYDDGDVELTKHARRPKGFFEDLVFDDDARLRAELISYGHNEPRIERALEDLKTETCVVV